jgi:hypothetical protein
MKGALASTLVVAAEALNWPMPVDYAAASPAERKAFEDAFAALLRLQELYVARRSCPHATSC